MNDAAELVSRYEQEMEAEEEEEWREGMKQRSEARMFSWCEGKRASSAVVCKLKAVCKLE